MCILFLTVLLHPDRFLGGFVTVRGFCFTLLIILYMGGRFFATATVMGLGTNEQVCWMELPCCGSRRRWVRFYQYVGDGSNFLTGFGELFDFDTIWFGFR